MQDSQGSWVWPVGSFRGGMAVVLYGMIDDLAASLEGVEFDVNEVLVCLYGTSQLRGLVCGKFARGSQGLRL